VDAGVAACGVSPLANHDGAQLGASPLSTDRFPGRLLLRGPKVKIDAPTSLDEIDPELLKTYEKLGIPLSEQKC